jgi:hypothetical protein
METINTEFSNFPSLVAVYYPKGDSVRIIHFTKDGYSEQTGYYFKQLNCVTGIENSIHYPFDGNLRCVSIGGHDLYYWYTGLRLLKLPNDWRKNKEEFPLFGFLNIRLPIPLSLFRTTKGMVEYFSQNEDWHSRMTDMRLLAQEEYEEYKDMPPLIPAVRNVSLADQFSHSTLFVEVIQPNLTDEEFSTPRTSLSRRLMSPKKPRKRLSVGQEVASEMDEDIPTYTANMDILLEDAKRIWWDQWRFDGNFIRKVKIMDLDLYSPQELLYYLRFVDAVNRRCLQNGQSLINLRFTMEERVKISQSLTNMSVCDRTELMILVDGMTF